MTSPKILESKTYEAQKDTQQQIKIRQIYRVLHQMEQNS